MPKQPLIYAGLTGLGGLLIALAIVIVGTPPAAAKSHFLGRLQREYPHVADSRLDGCVICHKDGIPDGPINRFADDYFINGRKFERIEAIDSDGDGFTNLEELQALTFPGDPQDFPAGGPAQAAKSPTAAPPTATPTVTPTSTPTAMPTPTPEPMASRIRTEPALMLMVAFGAIGIGLWGAVLLFTAKA